MLIHFQNNTLEIKTENGFNTRSPDLDECFEALTSGNKDLIVNLGDGGLRPLWRYLKDHYIFVKAAGGIVCDQSGKRLIMMRNGRYDLPKGKVEPGETLAQAALRETEEETGVGGLCIGPQCLKTYHIYNLYGGWHLKQTTWFAMRHTGQQNLVPQQEEGITSVEWVAKEEWLRRLGGSYATLRHIASQNTVIDADAFFC